MGRLWITLRPRPCGVIWAACSSSGRPEEGGCGPSIACLPQRPWHGCARQVDRLRRSVMVRRPAVRWGLALAAVLGLAAAGYWAVTSLSTAGVRYLASERQFSSDDLIKVCRALDKERSSTESTNNGGLKLRPISSTKLPSLSRSSIWASIPSTRSGANPATGASGNRPASVSRRSSLLARRFSSG